MRAAMNVLLLVHPESGGARKRSVLDAMARRLGAGPELIDRLIAAGRLVRYGRTKGATWGLPKPIAQGGRSR